VDFDVAFSLEDTDALAWGIMFGQMDGGKWSWRTMSWERKE
jgi:hypothetical protein